jgi:hypothetical protein
MSKVILLVNVDLESGKREDYISATNQLRSHFQTSNASNGISYSVFENQGKDGNSFTEMFTFPDMSTYEAFDDQNDEEANELFAKIIGLSKRSPKYTTLIEIQ